MPEWRYDKIDLGGLPRRTSDIDVLNDAGKDGWELVTIMPNGMAYVKQPIIRIRRKAQRASDGNGAPQNKSRRPSMIATISTTSTANLRVFSSQTFKLIPPSASLTRAHSRPALAPQVRAIPLPRAVPRELAASLNSESERQKRAKAQLTY